MPQKEEPHHVIVRLPFQRPEDFEEPPLIVWTEEMEHRLWQYTSQKNTDWNSIARELQVPTQILIRHAAFLYETQLRGIQQQLRMGEMGKGKASDSASASGRSSRASRPSSAMHAHSDIGNRPISTGNATSPIVDNVSDSLYLSTISAASHQRSFGSPGRPYMTRQTSQDKSSNSEPMVQTASPLPPLESSFHNMKRSRMAENEMTNSQLEDEASTKTSSASGSGVLQRSVPLDAWDRQELTGGGASEFAPDEEDSSQENDDYDNNDKDKNDNFEERFHELYVDEEDAPAFLPSSSRSPRGHSNSIMSLLKSVVIDKQSPFRHEPNSSSLPTSPDMRQQQPPSAQQLRSPLRHERMHQLSTAEEFTTEGTNSVGSSFSDVSDSSVTQSALEDAYMSKFNGSKMSTLTLSKKY
ncbi:hypothetical protein BC943DRAFT_326079 [Umbelopsis sp. AD052]|nr:hypothetical protein BC943DRAFT_326079 [Umbelopsis sp. AD052]